MMLWKIIFMIFGLSQAYIIHSIDQCAHDFHQCNPNLDLPCCEENNTCKLIYWNDGNYYECLKTITLDKPCQSDSDCSDSGSVICSPNEKVCKCSNNYLRVNDHKCASLLGGSCVKDSDCAVLNSICHRNKCKCESSYQLSSNDVCLFTTLKKPCDIDDDCWATNNTVCSQNGICACNKNYEKINNAVCESFLGGYCKDYTDCWPENSICIDNQCDCGYGFHPTSYQLCKASPLGKSCFNDIDCNQMSFGLKPTAWKYVCEEHKLIKNVFKCVPRLGNFCMLQRHCLINNSHCASNKCVCNDGYKSESGQKCVSTLPNSPCRSNTDCYRESLMCSNDKKCVCKQGYLEVNNRTCAPTLGQSCSEDSPCVATNSECFENLCHCKINHWPKSNTECVQYQCDCCRAENDHFLPGRKKLMIFCPRDEVAALFPILSEYLLFIDTFIIVIITVNCTDIL